MQQTYIIIALIQVLLLAAFILGPSILCVTHVKNGGTGNAMCKIGGLYVKCENINNITRKAVELCYIQPSGMDCFFQG